MRELASSKLLLREVPKRRALVYLVGLAMFGPLLFFGTNLAFYLRNPTTFGKPNTTMWLIGTFIISEAAGLLWSWTFLSKYGRMNKS